MIRKKSILLLKSQKGDGSGDKYDSLLNSSGFEVRQVKTLVFDFKNIDILREELKNDDNYAGLILSSPRCVHAVYLASEDNKNILHNWKTKYNFVVGETTHKDASEKLNLECEGRESGNAVNLSKLILKKKSLYDKPFLFPHGNLKTDTLNLELGKEGVKMEGVLVYDTIANPNIEKELADATDNFTSISEYVVFFSPSGLRSSINYLRKIPLDLNDVKIIAIGPVTELAIREENYKVYGVSKQPTPEEVLKLILN
ncbi:hypothetical protein NQ318_018490 [Aromia moschata]|uniref:Uroporphyrinogen-III synthase n=1 Tax=Aromia moschata TaxID=1265417 RepID=A0AAV8YNT8_9CUCU|nr:hypothetical protein NQ318_018490 [Aromia moschata]